MKSEREIRDKIDELFVKLEDVRHIYDDEHEARAEELRCNIDALLWVIGDRSGKPI